MERRCDALAARLDEAGDTLTAAVAARSTASDPAAGRVRRATRPGRPGRDRPRRCTGSGPPPPTTGPGRPRRRGRPAGRRRRRPCAAPPTGYADADDAARRRLHRGGVMDALDRLAEPGLDLLRRVDTLLAGRRARRGTGSGRCCAGCGCCPATRCAASSTCTRRRWRLPGTRCAGSSGRTTTSAATLTDPVALVRAGRRGVRRRHAAALLAPPRRRGRRAWSGGWSRPPAYADALADWVEGSRARAGPGPGRRARARPRRSPWSPPRRPARRAPTGPVGPGVAAAAEIAARVLAVLCVAYDGAETLLRQWAPSLAESTWRSTGRTGAPGTAGPTRVGRLSRSVRRRKPRAGAAASRIRAGGAGHRRRRRGLPLHPPQVCLHSTPPGPRLSPAAVADSTVRASEQRHDGMARQSVESTIMDGSGA